MDLRLAVQGYEGPIRRSGMDVWTERKGDEEEGFLMGINASV
jgi:hypothetical protein